MRLTVQGHESAKLLEIHHPGYVHCASWTLRNDQRVPSLFDSVIQGARLSAFQRRPQSAGLSVMSDAMAPMIVPGVYARRYRLSAEIACVSA